VACASLRYRSAPLKVVGVEPKGLKCNLKNLECSIRDVKRISLRILPVPSMPSPFINHRHVVKGSSEQLWGAELNFQKNANI